MSLKKLSSHQDDAMENKNLIDSIMEMMANLIRSKTQTKNRAEPIQLPNEPKRFKLGEARPMTKAKKKVEPLQLTKDLREIKLKPNPENKTTNMMVPSLDTTDWGWGGGAH